MGSIAILKETGDRINVPTCLGFEMLPLKTRKYLENMKVTNEHDLVCMFSEVNLHNDERAHYFRLHVVPKIVHGNKLAALNKK